MAAPSRQVKVKTAAAVSRKPARGVVSRLLWGWFSQPGRFLVALLGVGLLAALPSAPWLLPHLAERPEYQFAVRQVEIPTPHRWVSKNLVEEVIRGSELPESVSLLDPELTGKLARAWSAHPWVREVKSVTITSERQIIADIVYREPAAFVEVDQGVYPVDTEGALLPPVDFSAADVSRLPHVRGITSRPRGAAGTAWGDDVVVAAARLAALLTPQQDLELYWKRYGLDAILAPSASAAAAAGGKITLELGLVNGSRIVWGQAPGADPLEQPAEKKLARLDWLSRNGTLTAPNGPYSIDIRLFGDRVTVEPLDRTWR